MTKFNTPTVEQMSEYLKKSDFHPTGKYEKELRDRVIKRLENSSTKHKEIPNEF